MKAINLPSRFPQAQFSNGARAILLAAIAGLLALPVLAIDPPHFGAAYGIECSSCHVAHHSPGANLTTLAGNANVCMSCHVAGGLASTQPFVSADQALPWPGLPAGTNAAGNSHRWDSSAAGRLVFLGGTATPSTGTIFPSGVYTGYYAKTYTIQIQSSGMVGVAQFSWTATLPGGGAGTNLTGTNVLLDSGIFLSFADGTNTSFQAGDQWNLFARTDLQNPTNGNLLVSLMSGAVACSTCHDEHSEAQTPFDPNVQPYTTNAFGTFIGTNRHFMRIANDSHQLCNDCHAPRAVTNAIFGSHPVEIAVAADAYHKSPALLPVEGASGNLGCLTCHQIHFGPDNDGKLLRLTNVISLCTDCHLLADADPATPAAHYVRTNSATLWPGGKNGSLMPARTDLNDRGTCLNCHAVHGWPDAANPTNHYPHLLADYEENFCFTCHGTNGPAAKLVQSAFTSYYHHPVADNDPKRRAGRSVECVDCHNPHRAMAGSHNYTNTATAFRNAITNTPSLIGVDGVYVNFSGLTNYQVIGTNRYSYIADTVGVTNEYQICFKCHSGWSYPSYNAGTASFTTNSTTVTGSGTAWNSSIIGQWIARSNDWRSYVITAVASATSLTISPAYANPSASGQFYFIRNYTPGLTPIFSSNTVTFTSGNTAVTGSTTGWTTNLIGTWIYNSNSPTAVYKIVAVASATSLTISPAYAGPTASGQTYGISGDTDLAQEFSPMNKSGHPIVTGLDNYPNSIVMNGKRGLLAAAMKAPWNVNVGQQTMLCSDCHDTTTTNYIPSVAQGPHGSAVQFILRGPNGNNWPDVANTTAGFTSSWCANCHNNSSSTYHGGNHTSYRCYACHIVIPHGGKVSRLLGANGGGLPARYAFNNNPATMRMTGVTKTNATSYSSSTCGGCGEHSNGSEKW